MKKESIPFIDVEPNTPGIMDLQAIPDNKDDTTLKKDLEEVLNKVEASSDMSVDEQVEEIPISAINTVEGLCVLQIPPDLPTITEDAPISVESSPENTSVKNMSDGLYDVQPLLDLPTDTKDAPISVESSPDKTSVKNLSDGLYDVQLPPNFPKTPKVAAITVTSSPDKTPGINKPAGPFLVKLPPDFPKNTVAVPASVEVPFVTKWQRAPRLWRTIRGRNLTGYSNSSASSRGRSRSRYRSSTRSSRSSSKYYVRRKKRSGYHHHSTKHRSPPKKIRTYAKLPFRRTHSRSVTRTPSRSRSRDRWSRSSSDRRYHSKSRSSSRSSSRRSPSSGSQGRVKSRRKKQSSKHSRTPSRSRSRSRSSYRRSSKSRSTSHSPKSRGRTRSSSFGRSSRSRSRGLERPVDSLKGHRSPGASDPELERKEKKKGKKRKTQKKAPEKPHLFIDDYCRMAYARHQELTAEKNNPDKEDDEPGDIKLLTIKPNVPHKKEKRKKTKTPRHQGPKPDSIDQKDVITEYPPAIAENKGGNEDNDREVEKRDSKFKGSLQDSSYFKYNMNDVTEIARSVTKENGENEDKVRGGETREELKIADQDPENCKSPDDTIVHPLRLMAALEEQMGSLAAKVYTLLGQAAVLEMEKTGSSFSLLENKANVVQFLTFKETLKGQLMAGMVNNNLKTTMRMTVDAVEEMFNVLKERNAVKKRVAPATLPVSNGAEKILKRRF